MNSKACAEEPASGRSSVRAKPSSPSLTLDDAIEIWRRHWLGEAQHVIAAGFGVNQGRVCEVLSAKRFSQARDLALKGHTR